MSYRVLLGPNARRDRDRIVAYYDNPEILQGDRFLDDFYQAARQIEERPHIGRPVEDGVRRWHLGVFPCQLWYRVSDDLRIVRIIAVVGDAQDRTQFEGR